MDANTKATLAFVNRIRVAYKLEPLQDLAKGYRRISFNCPISNSFKPLDVRVCMSQILLVDGDIKNIPEELMDIVDKVSLNRLQYPQLVFNVPRESWFWISDFDSGKYPQYSLSKDMSIPV